MENQHGSLPVTGLRFVAASAVVILHFGRQAPSLAWADRLWDHGNLAVSFFFTLSGFVLAYVYRGGVRDVRSFYVARAARIVPLYWLSLAATVAYAWRVGACDSRDVLASLLMIQAWIPGRALHLNWPGWSLSVEMFFYLTFPFVFARTRKLSSLRVVLLGLGVWLLQIAATDSILDLHPAPHSPLEELAYCNPLLHFDTFLLGVCGGILFARGARVRPRTGVWAAAIALALILHGGRLVQVAQNGLLAPLFLVVIGAAASRRNERPTAALLGEASYSFYILQAPVALWCGAFGPHGHPDTFFWCLFDLLVVLSVVSYKLVEVPAREWIKSLFHVRRPELSR